MDLEDLRAAQSRERASDGLQDLRESFYEDVAAYIQSLKEERDERASAADDPFGDERVQALTDEIETAEQVAEAIYERRMGKLVKQASLAAAGMEGDRQGLTQEEQALYDDLVERITENKSHVLDVIAGDAEPRSGGESAAESSSEPEPTASESESSAAAAMGGDLDAGASSRDESEAAAVADEPPEPAPGTESAAEPEGAGQGVDGTAGQGVDGSADETGEAPADVDRTTVRITQDVGEIFGVDERPYVLEADDVVTLPTENAAPLVERDAAEELSEQ